MIQLKIVSGKMAGAVMAARHFPVQVGRAPDAHLQLEENGVWEEHLQIDFKPGTGFVLEARPNAITSVNGRHVQTTILRNGDLIEIGSTKIRFWLGEVRQRNSRIREWLVWTIIVCVSLGQVALIYWLMAD
jgi:pSer/pThr/pTyr-binding forkhead associated (FHA) protein